MSKPTWDELRQRVNWLCDIVNRTELNRVALARIVHGPGAGHIEDWSHAQYAVYCVLEAINVRASTHPEPDDQALAERDELREALRAARRLLGECGAHHASSCICDWCERRREFLSRHPAQPVKGTPGG